MGDTTVKKVQAANSPRGRMGQLYLAEGKSVAMRLWDEQGPSSNVDAPSRRPYETVGYVVAGRARLHLEGQTLTLEAGDSWLVPADAEHAYEILEAFTAVEATSPPAHIHDRDAA